MAERKSCRKFYKELRNAMSREAAAGKSKVICERILACREYKQAQMIYGYYPLGNEVNCLKVLEQALKDKKRVALPRTSDCNQMDFFEIQSLSDVEEGAFHIMEPKAAKKPSKQTDVNTLVLVPGVVFDREGNRYGYGKGFYDRYFARFPGLTRVAPAYTEQLSEKGLECFETDVKMHVIVTEKEAIKVKKYKSGESDGINGNL